MSSRIKHGVLDSMCRAAAQAERQGHAASTAVNTATKGLTDAQTRPQDGYAGLHNCFRWDLPEYLNMAWLCLGRHAQNIPEQVAVREHRVAAPPLVCNYAQLQAAVQTLVLQLKAAGVLAGDRVAIALPQGLASAAAYMAVLQMGAVAVPLSQLFGPEALLFRLQNSQAKLVLLRADSLPLFQSLQVQCPSLHTLLPVDSQALLHTAQSECGLRGVSASDYYQSRADAPAILMYTSGTTGNPKGAVIPHQALLGNLTGFLCSQNWFGFDPENPEQASQAILWSPADWAWTGGLMNVLLPALYFGRELIAYAGRFSPETAFTLLQDYAVSHTFLFPTALKAMMKAYPEPKKQFRIHLQACMSAGEAVGDAVCAYCQNALGVVLNEMFGQTEINYVVGNSAMNQQPSSVAWPAKPGSMGRAYPGHRVTLLDTQGQEVPAGEIGEIAVHRRDVHGDLDPVFFLGYWGDTAATQAKYTGDPQDSWCRTGDLALQDAQGYFWYQGRVDDVFKSAGYRISPSEVENSLIKHPAVLNAAVVPKPDGQRGAVVKAYVVLSETFEASDALVQALQAHVKHHLASYEYPKEIEFVQALPMTASGKVQRRVLRLAEIERARKL